MERTITAMSEFGRRRQSMQAQDAVPKRRGRPPKHEKKENKAAADVDDDFEKQLQQDTTIPPLSGEPASTKQPASNKPPIPHHSSVTDNTTAMPPQDGQLAPGTHHDMVDVLSDSTEY
eukprot:4966696-Amphidinium_carterae.1